VNYIREFQVDRGIPPAQAYNTTLYVLAGLLLIGFLCNLMMRSVAERYYMTEEELAAERKLAHEANASNKMKARSQMAKEPQTHKRPSRLSWVLVGIAWMLVGVPLLWGILITLEKAVVLFR
jgi:uncharacterized membrane protein